MWCKNLVFNGIFLKFVVKMIVGCKKWVLLGE